MVVVEMPLASIVGSVAVIVDVVKLADPAIKFTTSVSVIALPARVPVIVVASTAVYYIRVTVSATSFL